MTTALVVNDLVLRTKIKEAAASSSRSVTFFRTAEQILSLLESPDASVSTIIVDLHATSLDPIELATQLSAITPRPKLIGFFLSCAP